MNEAGSSQSAARSLLKGRLGNEAKRKHTYTAFSGCMKNGFLEIHRITEISQFGGRLNVSNKAWDFCLSCVF